jgi:hypothetical protein
MDSTACLLGSHVPHVELSFQFLPVGKRGVEKNNPIAGHPQPHLRLILSRSHLLRLPKHRAHARVRHICLHGNAGPCNRLGSGICQPESDRDRADPDWLGRDSVLDRDPGRRCGSPGAAGHKQHSQEGRSQEISTWAQHPAGYPSDSLNGAHRCEGPTGLRCHAAQPGRLRQLSLSCHYPMRKCSSGFAAHPLAGTCGSTCRSPWG